MLRNSCSTKTSLFLFFTILIFLIQSSVWLDFWIVADLGISIIRVIVAIALILLYIHYKIKPTLFEIVFFLLMAILLFSTLANNPTNIIQWMSVFFSASTLVILFRFFFKQHSLVVLRYFANIFLGLIALNFLLLLLYPNGLVGTDSAYFLGGNYNQMCMTLFCGCITNTLYSYISNERKILTFILFAISIISVLIVGSMTATVSLIFIALFLVFSQIISYRMARLCIIISFVGSILFHFVVVVLSADISEYPFIAYFIENILGKDLTFTHRTDVWSGSIDLMSRSNIWFGNGMLTSYFFLDEFDVPTPHNMIILFILEGGIVCLSCVVGLYLIANHHSKTFSKRKIIQFMKFANGVCLLTLAVETYNFSLLMYLMVLLEYSAIICSTHDKLFNNYSTQKLSESTNSLSK